MRLKESAQKASIDFVWWVCAHIILLFLFTVNNFTFSFSVFCARARTHVPHQAEKIRRVRVSSFVRINKNNVSLWGAENSLLLPSKWWSQWRRTTNKKICCLEKWITVIDLSRNNGRFNEFIVFLIKFISCRKRNVLFVTLFGVNAISELSASFNEKDAPNNGSYVSRIIRSHRFDNKNENSHRKLIGHNELNRSRGRSRRRTSDQWFLNWFFSHEKDEIESRKMKRKNQMELWLITRSNRITEIVSILSRRTVGEWQNKRVGFNWTKRFQLFNEKPFPSPSLFSYHFDIAIHSLQIIFYVSLLFFHCIDHNFELIALDLRELSDARARTVLVERLPRLGQRWNRPIIGKRNSYTCSIHADQRRARGRRQQRIPTEHQKHRSRIKCI